METWLLDTGPVVAYLDDGDPAHGRVVSSFDGFTGRFITTDAVVVEAMHFLSRSPQGAAVLVDFLLSSQATIQPSMSAEMLMAAGELMATYADVPMDFADATLVLAAGRLRLTAICTLDRRGFRTYRAWGRKGFDLVLDGDRR